MVSGHECGGRRNFGTLYANLVRPAVESLPDRALDAAGHRGIRVWSGIRWIAPATLHLRRRDLD